MPYTKKNFFLFLWLQFQKKPHQIATFLSLLSIQMVSDDEDAFLFVSLRDVHQRLKFGYWRLRGDLRKIRWFWRFSERMSCFVFSSVVYPCSTIRNEQEPLLVTNIVRMHLSVKIPDIRGCDWNFVPSGNFVFVFFYPYN